MKDPFTLDNRLLTVANRERESHPQERELSPWKKASLGIIRLDDAESSFSHLNDLRLTDDLIYHRRLGLGNTSSRRNKLSETHILSMLE